jgi:protocatechuate 3,4-dioxygenase alpha subunit
MSVMRTPSQTVGPFYTIGLCRRLENELVPRDDPGAVQLTGQLLDGEGTPIGDGVIEVWDPSASRWGRCGTDADGRFWFTVGKTPYLEVYVFARGLLMHQLTRVYFPDADEDAVLSSLDADDRETLVAEQEAGALRFDIRLQGDRETVFFAH